jgi:nitric oxide reductase subunit B
MAGGMAFMTFVLTFAGTIQTHLQRVLGQYYMEVQDQIMLFHYMRFGAGVAVVLGAVLFVFATLVPRREVIASGHETKQLSPAE